MKNEHKEILGSIARRLGTGAIDFETAYKEALSLIATIEAVWSGHDYQIPELSGGCMRPV